MFFFYEDDDRLKGADLLNVLRSVLIDQMILTIYNFFFCLRGTQIVLQARQIRGAERGVGREEIIFDRGKDCASICVFKPNIAPNRLFCVIFVHFCLHLFVFDSKCHELDFSAHKTEYYLLKKYPQNVLFVAWFSHNVTDILGLK